MCVYAKSLQSGPILWDAMDCGLPGASVHGDSPGQNTGMGCHCLLQAIFPTQGSNPGLPHCRWILYHLSHQGSPSNTVTNVDSLNFSPLSSSFFFFPWLYILSYLSSPTRDQTHAPYNGNLESSLLDHQGRVPLVLKSSVKMCICDIKRHNANYMFFISFVLFSSFIQIIIHYIIRSLKYN